MSSKKYRKKNRLLRLELLLLIPVLAGAFPMDRENGFYERKEEGWFWYREQLEVEKKEPEKRPVPKAGMAGKATPLFSTAWLRENLPKYRDMAIDNPTPDNVAAYFALQRLSMDKAEHFAQMAKMVPEVYPVLDENLRRPVANFAAQVADRESARARKAVLRNIARTVGIFFFFKSDCPFCHAQAPVMAMLERLYGFKVLPISIDGLPMPGDLYQDFRIDQGQARALGVTLTPTLFLVNPDADEAARLRLLGQGAMALPDMERKIVDIAFESGWIDRATYEKTLPVKPAYLKTKLPESSSEVDVSPSELLRMLGVRPEWSPA